MAVQFMSTVGKGVSDVAVNISCTYAKNEKNAQKVSIANFMCAYPSVVWGEVVEAAMPVSGCQDRFYQTYLHPACCCCHLAQDAATYPAFEVRVSLQAPNILQTRPQSCDQARTRSKQEPSSQTVLFDALP